MRPGRALATLVAIVAGWQLSCEPVGRTGLQATPVASVGPPASSPAPIAVQAVFDVGVGAGKDGPDIWIGMASVEPPPAGTRLAVVDQGGREGEVVTEGVPYFGEPDGAGVFLWSRWVSPPARAIGASPITLAIAPPSACGPACRVLAENPTGDAPAAVPPDVPLPPLRKYHTLDKGWWPAIEVDLDGDGTADLLVLARMTTRHGTRLEWGSVDEIMVQRTRTGWTTVPVQSVRPMP
jgi:hypothetical protein